MWTITLGQLVPVPDNEPLKHHKKWSVHWQHTIFGQDNGLGIYTIIRRSGMLKKSNHLNISNQFHENNIVNINHKGYGKKARAYSTTCMFSLLFVNRVTVGHFLCRSNSLFSIIYEHSSFFPPYLSHLISPGSLSDRLFVSAGDLIHWLEAKCMRIIKYSQKHFNEPFLGSPGFIRS